jgi:hypothetical protein
MAKLRHIQGILNGLWQTSELAYGYALSNLVPKCPNLSQLTIDVLGHIQTEVWYPNNQGRIKRDATIGQTLDQIRENTIHIYRASLLSFFSAFEGYLKAEVKHLKPPDVGWGEYVRSLSHESLRCGLEPLRLRTVLRADFCREVRNLMVHESFAVPTSLSAQYLNEWSARLQKRACDAGWPNDRLQAEVIYAQNQVIGQAIKHVQQAKTEGKDLPIEYFYMLFSFTNLDTLAFEIEEALRPPGSRSGGEVGRKQTAVRRNDLVVTPAA